MRDTAKTFAGAALALALHESGHLAFDLAFDADPRVVGVHLGPVPFVAVSHRPDLSPRREFVISSAGFGMQHAANEWLLTRRPRIRGDHAPVAKGVLAFNVLNSVGYALVAFARVGPYERDTYAMARSSGLDERVIGAIVLTPAVLDSIRYFDPEARWAKWISRGVKIGTVALVVKRR